MLGQQCWAMLCLKCFDRLGGALVKKKKVGTHKTSSRSGKYVKFEFLKVVSGEQAFFRFTRLEHPTSSL